MTHLLRFASALVALAVCALLPLGSASAQVTRDGSTGAPGVPPTEQIPFDGVRFDIAERFGTRQGGLLIHSFGRFDVAAGQIADFSAVNATDAVLARVTGGAPSSVGGTVRLSGSLSGASLFLLNASGFSFAESVNFDVAGSTFVSTASFLDFSPNVSFPTTSTAPPPNLAGLGLNPLFRLSPAGSGGSLISFDSGMGNSITASGDLTLLGPIQVAASLDVETAGDFLFLSFDAAGDFGLVANVVPEASPAVQGALATFSVTPADAISESTLLVDTTAGATTGDVVVRTGVLGTTGSVLETRGDDGSIGGVSVDAPSAAGTILINGTTFDQAGVPITIARTQGTTTTLPPLEELEPEQEVPDGPDAEDSSEEGGRDVDGESVELGEEDDFLIADITGFGRPDRWIEEDFDPRNFYDPTYRPRGRAAEVIASQGVLEASARPAAAFVYSSPEQYAPPFPKTCVARPDTQRRGSLTAQKFGLRPSPEGLLLAFDVLSAPAPSGEGPFASAVSDALRESQRGRYALALDHWVSAVRATAAPEQADERAYARRGAAEVQQALGRYRESMLTLRHALEDAPSDALVRVSTGAALGQAQVALGRAARAASYLEVAEEQLPEVDRGVKAVVLNNAASQFALAEPQDIAAETPDQIARRRERALALYQQSAEEAAAAGRPRVAWTALANAARIATLLERTELARRLLARAESAAEGVPVDHQSAYLWLHMGRTRRDLARTRGLERELVRAHADFGRALEHAKELDDDLAKSYAWGYQAELYQTEGRFTEALVLSRLASRAAEDARAPESLYRWYQQQGQLLWQKGRANAAAESLRRALDVAHEARLEARDRFGDIADFEQTFAPVYVDLINVLLAGSDLVTTPPARQQLLEEARSVSEKLKAAELRNYFHDQCIADVERTRRTLDQVAGSAAVVYPILLPDRLELLVRVPGAGIRRTAPVRIERDQLITVLDAFVVQLANRQTEYMASSQALYEWLVRPYAGWLDAAGIDTIVFVPDGPLRRLPMGALHDGQAFLAERYALATSPGLSLLPARLSDDRPRRLLAAGISESVRGMSPLPSVPAELETIGRIYGGTAMLNDDFDVASVQDRVRNVDPVIVHFASHADFKGTPATSFIATHAENMSIDQLFDVVGMKAFQFEPLDLIVLSACNTALGDDRAALGLSGAAVRAGARSALGSLWEVDDPSTAALMGEFYTALRSGSSKARALERAQAAVRKDARWKHPYYWAPFLMINNWN